MYPYNLLNVFSASLKAAPFKGTTGNSFKNYVCSEVKIHQTDVKICWIITMRKVLNFKLLTPTSKYN